MKLIEWMLLMLGIVLTMLSLLASVLTATASNWWALALWMVTCAAIWSLVLFNEVKGLPVVHDYPVTRRGD